ncbi:MAG: response regulator [Vicinamibacterales bacterium]
MNSGAPETILLVEDDDALRQLAMRVLRNAGYRVVEAANGEDALNDVECHGHIDLLVTDIVMPKLGGVELAQRLCARDPNLRVVYMSGYSDAVLRKQGALRPGDAWITKPFSPFDLVREARNALNMPRACSP